MTPLEQCQQFCTKTITAENTPQPSPHLSRSSSLNDLPKEDAATGALEGAVGQGCLVSQLLQEPQSPKTPKEYAMESELKATAARVRKTAVRQQALTALFDLCESDSSGMVDTRRVVRLAKVIDGPAAKSEAPVTGARGSRVGRVDFVNYLERLLPEDEVQLDASLQKMIAAARAAASVSSPRPSRDGSPPVPSPAEQSPAVPSPAAVSSPAAADESLTETQQAERALALGDAFDLFDCDGSGSVEMVLLQDSTWPRSQQLEWTGSKISRESFVDQLRSSLPADEEHFTQTVQAYKQLAGVVSWQANAARNERIDLLSKVFDVFDLDCSGSIEPAELMELGMTRDFAPWVTDGSKWSESRNNDLVTQIDENSDGHISKLEFSEYFERALPKVEFVFKMILEEFHIVSQECRDKKIKMHEQQANLSDCLSEMEQKEKQALNDKEQNKQNKRLTRIATIRLLKLSDVFQLFDAHGDGKLQSAVFSQLYSHGWSPEQNLAVLDQMSRCADGQVNKKEFAHYFSDALPSDEKTFNAIIESFAQVAELYNQQAAEQAAADKAAETAKAASDSLLRQEQLLLVFDQLDIDDLGWIRAPVLRQLDAALAARLDSNSDGVIDKAEFLEHFELVLKNKSERKCTQMLQAFLAVAQDFRESQAILGQAQAAVAKPVSLSSKIERDKQVVKLFNILDFKGYGMIEVQALQQFASDPSKMFGSFRRLVEKIDKNGDGHINKAEFVRYFEAKLSQSEKEFNTIMESFIKLAKENQKRQAKQALGRKNKWEQKQENSYAEAGHEDDDHEEDEQL